MSRQVTTVKKTPHQIQVVLNRDHHERIRHKQSTQQKNTGQPLNPSLQNVAGLAEEKGEEATSPSQERFLRIIKELDHLVGLSNVKDFVYEIYALLQVNQFRKKAGLRADPQVLHMIFKGNPGTGKTTVARIMGRLFEEMGILSKGHLIEVERADLVGEYIGHTAQKTREHVKKALGGILFIDEAYSLARGGDKDFGKEAIDTLVKAMEDHKNDFILILAGYSREMENFLQSNPGLPSRFPLQIDFSDYSLDELLDIAQLMAEEREYKLTRQAIYKLKRHLQQEMEHSFNFSNARYVRNIIEQSIRYQAVRLVKHPSPTRDDLMRIGPEDLRLQEEKKDPLYIS